MNKKSRAAESQSARKALMWFSLTAFILKRGMISLGRHIRAVFIPEDQKRSGSGFSYAMQMIFSVMTLEGTRLMLISRYRAARMKRGTKVGISAAGGTAIAGLIAVTVLVGSQLLAVTVDGKVIGYVENEGQYTTLVQQAKQKISAEAGTEDTEILIQDTNVSLEPIIAPQQVPLTVVDDPVEANAGQPAVGSADSGLTDPAAGEAALVDSLIDSLKEDGAVKATYYTITINGERMATLGTMKEASEVLNTIAESYTPATGDYTGRFTDNVAINGITAELEDINLQNPDDVVAYLLTGTAEERSYAAVEGDTIETICAALGLNRAEFIREYPDLDPNKIEEGDSFVTTLNIPYIHYETVGTEIANDPVPYETIEENSSELFLGQSKTVEEGMLGERMVTRHMTRVNGDIIASTEIDSEMIKEPVAEKVHIGTKMVSGGDGAFVGPSDGTIGNGGSGPLGRPLTSWYLSRSVGGAHYGADMIAPQGTPIYAAEQGVVSFAGVWGGYGNLVIVTHANGLVTYYAHCDSFNTQEGAAVERGQQIATVGTTGRSTAFHLHFEVRVNNVVQEPMNWIG